MKIKGKVYRTVVIPALMYGAETWALKKAQEKKLEVLRYQPITTAVITDACVNTRWHHGAYTSPKEDTR